MDHPDFWYGLFLWSLAVAVPICAVIWLAWAVWTWVTRRRRMTTASSESLHRAESQESGQRHGARRRSLRVPVTLTVLVVGLTFLGLFKPWYDLYSDLHDWGPERSFIALAYLDSDYRVVVVTDSDNGEAVGLSRDARLIIALESDPSIVFSWYAGEIAGPELALDGEPAFVPPDTQVFTFIATDLGTPSSGLGGYAGDRATGARVQTKLRAQCPAREDLQPDGQHLLTAHRSVWIDVQASYDVETARCGGLRCGNREAECHPIDA